ncbi:MAG: hypothetical protein IJ165_15195 [Proteobacteria bacterium]|nr:hypothetical protein [Pseudomonadota bacterium]
MSKIKAIAFVQRDWRCSIAIAGDTWHFFAIFTLAELSQFLSLMGRVTLSGCAVSSEIVSLLKLFGNILY